MITRTVFTLLVCLACPLPALAAADGRWAGTLATPNGEIPVSFTFKTDGTALHGTTAGPDGMEIAISDGKIEGNSLTFRISLEFGGMPLELTYRGVLDGDQIALTMEVMGMPMNFTVKRVK